MKTFSAKADEVKRDWFLVDADGKTLGRLATEVALVFVESISQNTRLMLILEITLLL